MRRYSKRRRTYSKRDQRQLRKNPLRTKRDQQNRKDDD